MAMKYGLNNNDECELSFDLMFEEDNANGGATLISSSDSPPSQLSSSGRRYHDFSPPKQPARLRSLSSPQRPMTSKGTYHIPSQLPSHPTSTATHHSGSTTHHGLTGYASPTRSSLSSSSTSSFLPSPVVAATAATSFKPDYNSYYSHHGSITPISPLSTSTTSTTSTNTTTTTSGLIQHHSYHPIHHSSSTSSVSSSPAFGRSPRSPRQLPRASNSSSKSPNDNSASPPSSPTTSSLFSTSSSSSSSSYKLTMIEQLELAREREIERDRNALLVHSHPGDSFNISVVIRYLEKQLGMTIKTYHYRDKQPFCFVQCHTEEQSNTAVDILNGLALDGCGILSAQRVARVTPGKDPLESDDPHESRSATLVIKNLPFSLKQDQLKNVLHGYPVRPESVCLHYDASGMFRGMAFVKYATIQGAAEIYDMINGMDVGGRSIRVEYKRKKEQKSFEYDPSDEEMKKTHDQLHYFKFNSKLPVLSFPSTLSSYQRRQIHIIADKLDLDHYSEGDGDHRFLIISRRESSGVPIRTSPSYEKFLSQAASTPTSSSSLISTSPLSLSSPIPEYVAYQPPSSSLASNSASSFSSSYSSSYSSSSSSSSSSNSSSSSWRDRKLSLGSSTTSSFSGSSSSSSSNQIPDGSSSRRQNRRSSVHSISIPSQMAKSPGGGSNNYLRNRDRSAGPTCLHPIRQPTGPDPNKRGFSQSYQERRLSQICASSSPQPSRLVAVSNS